MPRACLGQVAVPDVVGALAQHDALPLVAALVVEDAELGFLAVLGEHREIDTLAVPGGAQRVGSPGQTADSGVCGCFVADAGGRRASSAPGGPAMGWRLGVTAGFFFGARRRALGRPLLLRPPVLDPVGRPVLAGQAEGQRQGEHDAAEDDQEALAHDVAADLDLVERDQHHEQQDCVLRHLAQQQGVLDARMAAIGESRRRPRTWRSRPRRPAPAWPRRHSARTTSRGRAGR